MAMNRSRRDHERCTIGPAIGAEPSSIDGEYRLELERVSHDDERGIGVIHWYVAVPIHESDGVVVSFRLEGDDWDADREQELQRQRRRSATSSDEMTGFCEDGFGR